MEILLALAAAVSYGVSDFAGGVLTSIFQEESDKVIKRHPTPLLTCDDA
jgi:hypothetical protein